MKPAFALLCCLLLAGCAGGPAGRPGAGKAGAGAEDLLARGDYPAAAREFLRLAETRPDDAAAYRLRATAAWLEAGRLDAAADLLENTRITAGDAQLALRRRLLQARLDLARDRPEEALARLPAALPDDADRPLRADYHRVRAGALEARNAVPEAVRERILLAQYLDRPAARQQNSERLWRDLGKLDTDALESLAAGGSEELTGWVELALLQRRLLASPDQLEAALDDWRRGHRDHPGTGIIPDLLARSRALRVRPASIALLLPFSGPYQRASEAIRDGFLSAWYDSAGYHPAIRIYDTDALNIIDNYEKAVADGAELIVGPLEKAAIRTLIDTRHVSIDTLSLNQVAGAPDDQPPAQPDAAGRLYQFALSPEQEVRQIARRGLFEGFNRSLVLIPDNRWGERLAGTFSDEWRNLGGTLLESVRYDPDNQDFITPVKELLNIDSSEQRIHDLRRRLSRNIKADARRRQDAEFIYLAAVPVAARQIVPQFRFFRVEQTPIFSSSHIYSGMPDPQLDADMNGVEFTDIPWVLRSGGERPPIQKTVENNWLAQYPAYRRLFAFGVDAFRLIPQLGRMSQLEDYRYNGQTGELSMNDDGHIQRRLQWARFVNGRPVPLDTGKRLEPDQAALSQR